MDTINKAYKKLTNANGAVRVFSIIALILSFMGVMLEPLGKLLYNMIFKNDVKHLLISSTDSFKSYVFMSEYSIIFFVMTIVLMVAAFSSKHKKNIGQGFGSLFVLVPIVTSIVPLTNMIDYLKSRSFEYAMKGSNNIQFRAISTLLVYLLPVCTATLLVICGLILVSKASGEKPTEITYVPTKINNRPSAPQGFVPQNQFGQFGQPNNQFNPQQNGFGQPANTGFGQQNNAFGVNNGGFGAVPFAAPSENTQSPFAKPQENAVPASAPVMDEIRTAAPTEKPPFKDEPVTEKPFEPVKDEPKPFEPVQEEPKTLPKVCSDCGTVLADNAKFCKNCGKPVQ